MNIKEQINDLISGLKTKENHLIILSKASLLMVELQKESSIVPENRAHGFRYSAREMTFRELAICVVVSVVGFAIGALVCVLTHP